MCQVLGDWVVCLPSCWLTTVLLMPGPSRPGCLGSQSCPPGSPDPVCDFKLSPCLSASAMPHSYRSQPSQEPAGALGREPGIPSAACPLPPGTFTCQPLRSAFLSGGVLETADGCELIMAPAGEVGALWGCRSAGKARAREVGGRSSVPSVGWGRGLGRGGHPALAQADLRVLHGGAAGRGTERGLALDDYAGSSLVGARVVFSL